MSKENKLKKEYICPKCKEKQFTVIEDRLQRVYYTVDLEDESCQLNDYGDVKEVAYYCPNCDKKLPNELVNCLNL